MKRGAIFLLLFGLSAFRQSAAAQQSKRENVFATFKALRRPGKLPYNVQRAIDLTKQRQAHDRSSSAQVADVSSRARSAQQRVVRSEKLDVERLNKVQASIRI